MNFSINMRQFAIIFVFGLRFIYSSNKSSCVDDTMEAYVQRPEIAEINSIRLDQVAESSNSNCANTSKSDDETSNNSFIYPEWMFTFDGDMDKYFERTTESKELKVLVDKMCDDWKYNREDLRVLDEATCSAMKLFCLKSSENFIVENQFHGKLKDISLTKHCDNDVRTPSLLFDHTVSGLAFAYNLFINYENPMKQRAYDENPLKSELKAEFEALLKLMSNKLDALHGLVMVLMNVVDLVNSSPDIAENRDLIAKSAISGVLSHYSLTKFKKGCLETAIASL